MNKMTYTLIAIWFVFAVIFTVSLFCPASLFFTVCNYAFGVANLPLIAGTISFFWATIKEKNNKEDDGLQL